MPDKLRYQTAAAQQPASDIFFISPPTQYTNQLLRVNPVKSNHTQPDINYKQRTELRNAPNMNGATIPHNRSIDKLNSNIKLDSTELTTHQSADGEQYIYIHLHGPDLPHKLQYITIPYDISYTVDELIVHIRQYTLITTPIALYRNTPWQPELVLYGSSTLDELYVIPSATLTASYRDKQPYGIFEMLLNIVLPSGVWSNGARTIQMNVQCTNSIIDIKHQLYKQYNIPINEIKLYYNKQILCDTMTIKQYNVQHNNTIQLIHKYRDVARWDGRPSIQSIAATHTDNTSLIQPYSGFIVQLARQVDSRSIPRATIDAVHLINVSCDGVLIPGTIKLSADRYTISYQPHSRFPLGSTLRVSINPASIYNEHGCMKSINNSHTFHTIKQSAVHLIVTSPQLAGLQYTIVLPRQSIDLLSELKHSIISCMSTSMSINSITHIVHNNQLITDSHLILDCKPGDTIRVAFQQDSIQSIYIDTTQYQHSQNNIQQNNHSIDSTDDDTQDSTIDCPSLPASINSNNKSILIRYMSADGTQSTPFMKINSTACTIQQLVDDIAQQTNHNHIVDHRLDILYFEHEFNDYVLLNNINELPHTNIKLLVQLK